MIIEVKSVEEMLQFGERIGKRLQGGEVVELIGDVGSGKTTFVKGLASGLVIKDDVQSPSFTISRMYDARDGLQLAHYDFYRLNDAGIMASELQEMVQDQQMITVIEWANIVEGVLPSSRITLTISAPTEETRRIDVLRDPKGLIL